MSSLRRAAAAAMVCVVTGGLAAAEDAAQPLPEPRAFLEEVRQNLRSDRLLLEQYTFTERQIERRLDGKGAVKKATTRTYEVYPSAEPGRMYRRLVARDGVPVPETELAAEDRKHESRIVKKERERADENDAARAARETKEAEKLRQEKEVVDELYRMDDLVVEGREPVDGRPAIVVSFTPRPGYKPATAGGKVLQKLAGRAWIDEEDKQLVRIEARLLENLGVGPAGIARLQKGATAYFYRKKVNREIWLPTEARFTGVAKVLLFYGPRVDALFEYGDYKKFSVTTDESISDP